MFIRIHRLNNNAKYGILALLVYSINRFVLKPLELPLFDYILQNHFNDFLGGFIFCCYVNTLMYYNRKKMITNFWFIIISMFCVSISWEFIFPLFLKYSTSDWLDVLAYMLGTLLYYALLNKSNKEYNNVIVEKRHTKSTS